MKPVYPLLLFILLHVSLYAQNGKYSELATRTAEPVRLDERTLKLDSISADTEYGYSEKTPILAGFPAAQRSPLYEYMYLNALTGPNGEKVSFRRLGSCCGFSTPNGLINNSGLLDRFEVTYPGLEKPLILYLNMYDAGELKAPYGLGFRKE